MKKMIRHILSTTAAAFGLLMAGVVTAKADTTYTVKPGDCVWAISKQVGSSVATIESANHIQNNLILPGQILTIPAVSGAATNTTTTSPSAATGQTSAVVQKSIPVPTSATITPATVKPTTQPVSTAVPVTTSNTNGNLQSDVLTQMATRTGVSADTWNHIITRESGWEPQVRNSASGAYGLFQNIHISSGSVESQVNAAVNLYHAQGMSAWAL